LQLRDELIDLLHRGRSCPLQHRVDAVGHHLAFVLRLALSVGHDVASHELVSASTSVSADWSCSTLLCVLRAMFGPPFGAPRGRTSTSETPRVNMRMLPLGGQVAQILGSNFASDAHWDAAGVS